MNTLIHAAITTETGAARLDAAQVAAADYPIRLQDAEPSSTATGAARDIPAATTPIAGCDPGSRRAP